MCNPRVDIAAAIWFLAASLFCDPFARPDGPARPAAVAGEGAAFLGTLVVYWRLEGRRIKAEREADSWHERGKQ